MVAIGALASLSEIRGAIAEVDVPTTAAWRLKMKLARERLGWSQGHLADLCDTSQATVSQIETGAVGQSDRVPCIAVALDIAPPFVPVEDDADLEWIAVGKELREKNPAKRDAILAVAKLDLATPKKSG